MNTFQVLQDQGPPDSESSDSQWKPADQQPKTDVKSKPKHSTSQGRSNLKMSAIEHKRRSVNIHFRSGRSKGRARLRERTKSSVKSAKGCSEARLGQAGTKQKSETDIAFLERFALGNNEAELEDMLHDGGRPASHRSLLGIGGWSQSRVRGSNADRGRLPFQKYMDGACNSEAQSPASKEYFSRTKIGTYASAGGVKKVQRQKRQEKWRAGRLTNGETGR